MDTSFSWIKAYVPELDCTAQEYTDAMTLSGTIRLRNILTQTNSLFVRYRWTKMAQKYRL